MNCFSNLFANVSHRIFGQLWFSAAIILGFPGRRCERPSPAAGARAASPSAGPDKTDVPPIRLNILTSLCLAGKCFTTSAVSRRIITSPCNTPRHHRHDDYKITDHSQSASGPPAARAAPGRWCCRTRPSSAPLQHAALIGVTNSCRQKLL